MNRFIIKEMNQSALDLVSSPVTHIAAILSFSIGYVKQFVLAYQDQYIAIFSVIVLDFIFGSIAAKKQGTWETRKAFKIVYYLFGYWSVLSVVLMMERAFPLMIWLSEAVILPILTFQIVSALKNMHLAGLINSAVLKNLLDKIDKYKEPDNENSDHDEI